MAKKKITLKQAELLFVRLGWWILEQKFLYYEGSKYNLKPVPDTKYDKNETLYNKLAKKLNKRPTASGHVGFPHDTPSGKLVASRIVNTKGKHSTSLKINI